MIFAVLLIALMQTSALQNQPFPSYNIRGSIQPVFHNVRLHHVGIIAGVIFDRAFCSISLRQTDALESLSALCELLKAGAGTCVVGASTINTIDEVPLHKYIHYRN